MESHPSVAVTTTGDAPTSVPVEYSISVANNLASKPNIESYLVPTDTSIKKSQIFVSHNDMFELWQKDAMPSHSLSKLLMVDSTGPMIRDLTNAYDAFSVSDFVIQHGFNSLDLLVEEHLIVTHDTPLISMVANLGNRTSTLFTGISFQETCAPSLIEGNETENPGCDVWYDTITAPLYQFTFDEYDDASGPSDVPSVLPNSTTRHLRRSTNESETSANNDEPEGEDEDENVNQTTKESQEPSSKDGKSMGKSIYKKSPKELPLGFVTFNRVKEGNQTVADSIVSHHIEEYTHFSKQKIVSLITFGVLAVLGLIVVFRMWTIKYRNYTPIVSE